MEEMDYMEEDDSVEDLLNEQHPERKAMIQNYSMSNKQYLEKLERLTQNYQDMLNKFDKQRIDDSSTITAVPETSMAQEELD